MKSDETEHKRLTISDMKKQNECSILLCDQNDLTCRLVTYLMNCKLDKTWRTSKDASSFNVYYTTENTKRNLSGMGNRRFSKSLHYSSIDSHS